MRVRPIRGELYAQSLPAQYPCEKMQRTGWKRVAEPAEKAIRILPNYHSVPISFNVIVKHSQ